MKKQIALWFIKLAGLTLAIYWFMTKGFTSTVGQGTGLSNSQNGIWQLSGIDEVIMLCIFVFFILVLVYQRRKQRKK